MSPLSRLFKPPTPPPTLAERIAALDSAGADAFASIASGDEEEALRLAAIDRLADGPVLRLLGGLASPTDGQAPPSGTVQQAAQRRLARLIDQGAIDFPGFCAEPSFEAERLAIVSLCADGEPLQQMIAAVDDPSRLADLAIESSSSRVRQLAATAIEDPAQLRSLLKRLRGKDKTVYRIIKQKCDALIAEVRKGDEAAREASAVCAALERHRTAIHDAIYATTLEVLSAQWRRLEPRPEAELEQRAQLAIERCQQVIDSHLRAIAGAAAERAARDGEREDAARAREAAALSAAERAEAQAHAAALTAAEAAATREAQERTGADRREAQEKAHRQIGGLLRLARDALQAGNTRKAASFRLAVEDKLQSAPPLPPHLARTLQQLDDKLNELRHWKDYAVAPKRIELIEEMEALVGADDEPASLAERIRALQQEWRTINKGIVSVTPGELERFQRAQQAAFKPCQAYFEAQAALRRDNLEARRSIVGRLLALEVSQREENADRGLILLALREAPREFWRHAPVERDAGRTLHVEFDQAMDRLRAQLDAWHEANAGNRQLLITQARSLLVLEDSSQAIEGIKNLQARWRDAGALPRDRDQLLWAEFREVCDAVFARREQVNAQFAATLDAAKTQLLALCEQIEQAVRVEDSARLEAPQTIQGWRVAFDAIGELPRAEARALHERVERGVAAYAARVADQDRRAGAASVTNLLEAARHVRAYERAVDLGGEAGEREALKLAAAAFISGVQRWPKGGQQAIRQALAMADAASTLDEAAREKPLRMLCIRAELLSSTPTPTEDESLRREYQVARLMQGMGQGVHADDRDWGALLLEWVAIRAVSADRHDAFQKRFQRCLDRRPAATERTPYANHDGTDGRRERNPVDRGPRGDARGRSGPGGPGGRR